MKREVVSVRVVRPRNQGESPPDVEPDPAALRFVAAFLRLRGARSFVIGLRAPRRQCAPPGTARKKAGLENAEKSAALNVSAVPSGRVTEGAKGVASRMLRSWAVEARLKP